MQKMKVPYPVGLKVTDVRELTDIELEIEGWEPGYGDIPVAIIFDDGSMIYASSDPEGNGPGAIFGITKSGESLIVVPMDGNEETEWVETR